LFDQYLALFRKRYKIRPYNEDEGETVYPLYRMVPFSMTLIDPLTHIKVAPVFDAEYVVNGRPTLQDRHII